MDVSLLRLDSLNLRVEPCKQFTPPSWAVPGNAASNGAAIHVLKCGEVIETLKIDDNRLYTLFGRFPSCLDSNGIAVKLEHPSISRVHAAVLRGSDNTLFVIDLGSSHGTFVAGRRLEPFSASPLHDRSVLVFGQSSRRYIVRVFPKNVSACNDTEELNTLLNCQVSYKEQSPLGKPQAEEQPPAKLERRVSFSCMAPEIIPVTLPATEMNPDGASTPLSVFGASPEVNWLRKGISASAQTTFTELSLSSSPEPITRSKSDSLPSVQINSGSDEDDEMLSSAESLELSPMIGGMDESKHVSSPRAIPSGKKAFYKRLPGRLDALTKRLRPEHNS